MIKTRARLTIAVLLVRAKAEPRYLAATAILAQMIFAQLEQARAIMSTTQDLVMTTTAVRQEMCAAMEYAASQASLCVKTTIHALRTHAIRRQVVCIRQAVVHLAMTRLCARKTTHATTERVKEQRLCAQI